MAAGLTIEPGKLDMLADWLDERLSGAVLRSMEKRAMLLDLALAPRGG